MWAFERDAMKNGCPQCKNYDIMKKFFLAVATVAFMASCGGGASNDYAKAVVAACDEAVEAIEAAETEKDLKRAREDYWKAMSDVKEENEKAQTEMERAYEDGDEAILADYAAVAEAEMKVQLAVNKKKAELDK